MAIKNHKIRGVAITETLIVMPILLLLGMGIIHLGLIYQAKSNLEYAALMAARVGSTSCINITEMKIEVMRRMRASDLTIDDLADNDAVTIEVLNPDRSAFNDFGGPATTFSGCMYGFGVDSEIPNDFLMQRPTTPGGDSGISIQDANILRIRVTYRYDTRVPFMNAFYLDGRDGEDVESGVNLVAYSTVRMQSPARITTENGAFIN